MTQRLLWQLQLSSYTSEGKFTLTADSNWQMFATKLMQIVRLRPNLEIDVIVPKTADCLEDPYELLKDLGALTKNVRLLHTRILPNAPATRYDFSFDKFEALLADPSVYTHVYVNDPMLLSNIKAFFHLKKLKPRFILQTHFMDSPVGRVVDAELSYWYGIVDACTKADVFLWHCKSMQDQFQVAMRSEFQPHVIDKIMKKSAVWKDGFSITEISKPINMSKLRFDPKEVFKSVSGKVKVWVPNRIGGLGKSFDYTNNGKFLFEIVPELWKQRQDFVILAGNPNQKITNDELATHCPAYLKLVDGPLNRDEYRFLSKFADIVGAFYTLDENGGLAALEAINHRAVPLFPDVFEYKVYFDEVKWPRKFRCNPELDNVPQVLSRLIDDRPMFDDFIMQDLRKFINSYAAYENTTEEVLENIFRI